MFSVPRFYARLTLSPSKRPHPSLLYIMYASGVRASSQPALRALEGQFFDLAQSKAIQGMASADRLLDVTRAYALMSGYLFAIGRYTLGYYMSGMAIR